MTVTVTAMQMQLQVKQLMRDRGITLKPYFVPLSAPTDYPVEIEGLASTTDVDLSRQKFRAYAFCNLFLTLKGYELPPLYYKHDESQIAGTIDALSYDDKGNLKIRAEVTHHSGQALQRVFDRRSGDRLRDPRRRQRELSRSYQAG